MITCTPPSITGGLPRRRRRRQPDRQPGGGGVGTGEQHPGLAQRARLGVEALRIGGRAADRGDERHRPVGGGPASRTAAATAPAGSAWAPWPSTTSSSTTPTVGSSAAAAMRAARAAGSIIGCGRPAVYWSSPRSITSAASPARPSSTLASPASVPPVYSPSTRPAGAGPRRRLGDRRRQRDPGQPGGLDRGPLQGAAHGDRRRRPRRRPCRAGRPRPGCRPRRSSRGGRATARRPPVPAASRRRRSPRPTGPPTSRSRASSVITPPTAAERSRPPTPISAAFPTPGPVEQARHLLRPGARGRDDADRAGPQHVREAERHPVEHRGAAVRSHHQQPPPRGQRLEPHLVLDRDVVGEAHDVQPAPQRLLGDERRVRSGHRHGDHGRPGSARRCPRRSSAGALRPPADEPASVFDSAVEAKASASSTAPGSPPFTVISRSSGPAATPSGSMSDSASRRRFAGVAITTPARTMCSRCCSFDASASSATESR